MDIYLLMKKLSRKKNEFQKCLDVITVSADKLAVGPDVSDISEKSGLQFLVYLMEH